MHNPHIVPKPLKSEAGYPADFSISNLQVYARSAILALVEVCGYFVLRVVSTPADQFGMSLKVFILLGAVFFRKETGKRRPRRIRCSSLCETRIIAG